MIELDWVGESNPIRFNFGPRPTTLAPEIQRRNFLEGFGEKDASNARGLN